MGQCALLNSGGTPQVDLLLSKSTQYHIESFTLQDDYKYIIANVTTPIVREGYWLVIEINNGRTVLYDKAHSSSRGGRESNHRTITWENCKKGDVIRIGDGGGGAANSFDIYGIR